MSSRAVRERKVATIAGVAHNALERSGLNGGTRDAREIEGNILDTERILGHGKKKCRATPTHLSEYASRLLANIIDMPRS